MPVKLPVHKGVRIWFFVSEAAVVTIPFLMQKRYAEWTVYGPIFYVCMPSLFLASLALLDLGDGLGWLGFATIVAGIFFLMNLTFLER